MADGLRRECTRLSAAADGPGDDYESPAVGPPLDTARLPRLALPPCGGASTPVAVQSEPANVRCSYLGAVLGFRRSKPEA